MQLLQEALKRKLRNINLSRDLKSGIKRMLPESEDFQYLRRQQHQIVQRDVHLARGHMTAKSKQFVTCVESMFAKTTASCLCNS